MTKIYVAEWVSKTGKNIPFDIFECAGFDSDEVVSAARDAYSTLSQQRKSDLCIRVLAYCYTGPASPVASHFDASKIMFDAGGDFVAEFGGDD